MPSKASIVFRIKPESPSSDPAAPEGASCSPRNAPL
jgi:hypothetical protein